MWEASGRKVLDLWVSGATVYLVSMWAGLRTLFFSKRQDVIVLSRLALNFQSSYFSLWVRLFQAHMTSPAWLVIPLSNIPNIFRFPLMWWLVQIVQFRGPRRWTSRPSYKFLHEVNQGGKTYLICRWNYQETGVPDRAKGETSWPLSLLFLSLFLTVDILWQATLNSCLDDSSVKTASSKCYLR